MADDNQNTANIIEPETQNVKNNEMNPLNMNEMPGLLQFDDIAKSETELVMDKPGDAPFYPNIIILGRIPSEETKTCDLPLEDTEKSEANPPPKRKRPNELESLGVSELKVEFDAFTDEYNKIHRKYKLRNVVKKPDYRIPSINDLPILETKSNQMKAIKQEMLACPGLDCAKVFKSARKLNGHMRQEHNIEYKCSLCTQTFETNAELVSHKSIHEAENRSYVCHGCKLAFSDHCDFLIHQFTHSENGNKFVCPECGLVSLCGISIKKHILLHFNKKNTCPICSEEVLEHRLQEHMRVHKAKFQCVECGKVLTSPQKYDEHLSSHTGVKRHQCLYCGKGFATRCQKAIHTRIHTNERPYSCKMCDRTFVQCTNLLRHQATHDKTRKIQCDLCDKKFIQKNDLLCHMKTHRKAYSCPECGQKFSLMRSLRNHVLHKHSIERPVECKLCDKRFATNHHYRKHVQSKIHKRFLFKAVKNNE